MSHYLIWSIEHCAWWKPGKWGYTTATHAAGRFTYEEAKRICDEANRHGDEEEIAVFAPSRQQTTADLVDSGLKVPWLTDLLERADEAFAPSPAGARVKDAQVGGHDERLPTVPFGEDGRRLAVDSAVEPGVSDDGVPGAGLEEGKRTA
jgi:hypothetical protein